MSKIIFINGPSYSGKTWIHNRISSYLVSNKIKFYNICFEQYFKVYNAEMLFYDAILEKSEDRIVIAESVQSNKCNSVDSLNIVCWPGIGQHIENMKNCTELFGKDYTDSRVFGYSIEKIRKLFKYNFEYPNNFMLFNGNNFRDVLEMVNNYVSR